MVPPPQGKPSRSMILGPARFPQQGEGRDERVLVSGTPKAVILRITRYDGPASALASVLNADSPNRYWSMMLFTS